MHCARFHVALATIDPRLLCKRVMLHLDKESIFSWLRKRSIIHWNFALSNVTISYDPRSRRSSLTKQQLCQCSTMVVRRTRLSCHMLSFDQRVWYHPSALGLDCSQTFITNFNTDAKFYNQNPKATNGRPVKQSQNTQPLQRFEIKRSR